MQNFRQIVGNHKGHLELNSIKYKLEGSHENHLSISKCAPLLF